MRDNSHFRFPLTIQFNRQLRAMLRWREFNLINVNSQSIMNAMQLNIKKARVEYLVVFNQISAVR